MSARSVMVLAGLVLASCGREPERRVEANPYVVEVDVAPQIRAFGEETLTADEAAEQLETLGAAVIPALAAALDREPKDVRQKAVEVLARIGTAAAAPPLRRAAEHDADDDVRSDALIALGTIGDESARGLIERALDDPRVPIRAAGIVGCAALCTRPDTIDRLAAIAIHDENTGLALAARNTLAAIRAKGAAEEQGVQAAVDRRRPAALASDAKVDERALAALLASDLDGSAGVPALVGVVAAASPALQRQVAWRLGAVGDERALGALGVLLGSPDRLVQAYAYDALVRLRERGVGGADGHLASYAGQKPIGPLQAPEF